MVERGIYTESDTHRTLYVHGLFNIFLRCLTNEFTFSETESLFLNGKVSGMWWSLDPATPGYGSGQQTSFSWKLYSSRQT